MCFPDFELHEWSDASSSLEEDDAHQIFWRTAKELPPSLLILDTPDVDSDARVNWVRADAVRRCADVLIAVLTQQKYNDAAIKEFFRKAGDEDKAVLVVFNQCLLPEDEPYWPIWLDTFCRETHIHPDAVYLAPADRRAAEELRLPFYERPIPDRFASSSADLPIVSPAVNNTPRNLSADLANLKFREIRMRTLSGSLRELIHPQRGIPGYLRELRVASDDLAKTANRLSMDSVVQVRNWPAPTNAALVAEIREWWKARQEGWARRINSTYTVVGNGILWPFRAARRALQGDAIPPMHEYRIREWAAILMVVEELFDKLQWMSESGNEIIRARIAAVLKGEARADLLNLLKQRHEAVDFDEELRQLVDEQMLKFEKTKPDLFGMYRQLNNISAAVRPMTSVVLFSIGFGPAGELVCANAGPRCRFGGDPCCSRRCRRSDRSDCWRSSRVVSGWLRGRHVAGMVPFTAGLIHSATCKLADVIDSQRTAARPACGTSIGRHSVEWRGVPGSSEMCRGTGRHWANFRLKRLTNGTHNQPGVATSDPLNVFGTISR